MGNKLLIDQLHDYIRTSWSATCIIKKTDTILQATNNHLSIYYHREQGSTAFVTLAKHGRTVFDGYINTLDDFKLIADLTIVQDKR